MSTGGEFEKLVDIMTKLRSEDGCPWDREQTHDSLKKYLLEETYEVLESLDAGDMEGTCGELGDLMLQIVFHAQLAKEKGTFNIDDVMKGISSKLIRRHPHVFADAQVASSDEVLHRWEQIKSAEKGNENRTSILDGIPKALPALARAMDVSKRAAGAGFEWPDLDAVVEKLEEEVDELKAELPCGNPKRIGEEIGDLLFTVVNVARWTHTDAEESLRVMIERFSDRFKHIEEVARQTGRPIEELTIEEMDQIWNLAKQKKACHE